MGSTPKYTACALFWSSTCSWSGLWQSDQCVHCGNDTHLVMSATRPRALRSSNNPARRWKLRHCRRSGRQLACALEDNEYKPWRVSRITSAGNGDDDGLRARRMGRVVQRFPGPGPCWRDTPDQIGMPTFRLAKAATVFGQPPSSSVQSSELARSSKVVSSKAVSS